MSSLNLINSCDDPIRVREEYVANSTYATYLFNDIQNRTFQQTRPSEWTDIVTVGNIDSINSTGYISSGWIDANTIKDNTIRNDLIVNGSITVNKIRGQPENIMYWDEIVSDQQRELDEIYKVRALKSYEEERRLEKAAINPFTGKILVDPVKLKIQVEPDPASIPFKPSLPPPSPQLELF